MTALASVLSADDSCYQDSQCTNLIFRILNLTQEQFQFPLPDRSAHPNLKIAGDDFA